MCTILVVFLIYTMASVEWTVHTHTQSASIARANVYTSCTIEHVYTNIVKSKAMQSESKPIAPYWVQYKKKVLFKKEDEEDEIQTHYLKG